MGSDDMDTRIRGYDSHLVIVTPDSLGGSMPSAEMDTRIRGYDSQLVMPAHAGIHPPLGSCPRMRASIPVRR